MFLALKTVSSGLVLGPPLFRFIHTHTHTLIIEKLFIALVSCIYTYVPNVHHFSTTFFRVLSPIMDVTAVLI